ncbi:MAG: hypothetical protein KDC92_14370 [Bacteroidetes bacterium]|nr:hypothetical protein [Bacteroidota bacterium]
MRKLFYILLIGLVGISSCIKNDIELDVVEDGCRWLGIKNGKYELLDDPCTNGAFKIASNCTHNEDTGCVQFLKVTPTFYNEFNNEIDFGNLQQIFETPNFGLTESIISFEYATTLANQLTPETKANYAILNYFIESQEGDQSNTLTFRVHFPCTKISEDDYRVINSDSIVNIPRDQEPTFPVDFWDNAAEDGDLISAYLNSNVIVENLELFNTKKRFNVPKAWLNSGNNDLVVFALNEGSSGPNTVSMAVYDREIDLGDFAKGLRTGNAVRVDF